jgi:hypothetical protein
LFAAGTISGETTSRQKIVQLWECYSNYENDQCKQALLRHGETSLDVLIELLVTSPKQHYELVQEPADLRSALLQPATELLERRWPIEQLRNVARRNLNQLSSIEEVDFGWGSRPISPILASLRYSPDFADRELLGKFSLTARNGAAATAIDLMKEGLMGRTDYIAKVWRKAPPDHDYSKYAFACLDPKRPEAFESAMFYLIEDEKIVTRLHHLLPEIRDEKLRNEIYAALWHWYEDVEARNFLFEMLSSTSDEKFEDALYSLTDSQHSEHAAIIVRKLRNALHVSNPKRRKQILERLKQFTP